MSMKFDWRHTNGLARELGGRVELLENLIKRDYKLLQKIVRCGHAQEFFDIGDEIMTEYTTIDGKVHDYPWIVVDFRDVYWKNDDTPHPGVILQAKYGSSTMCFDASEDILVDPSETKALEGWTYYGRRGTTGLNYIPLTLSVGDDIPHSSYTEMHKTWKSGYGDRFDIGKFVYGCGRYRDSAIRQWLNKYGRNPSEWWESTHEGDVAPTVSTDAYPGFMNFLNKDFVDTIIPIKVKTMWQTEDTIDITYDRFFPPSIEEVYALGPVAIERGYVSPGIEGPYFQYWKEHLGLDEPDQNGKENRIFYFYKNHDEKVFIGLRSCSNNNQILQATALNTYGTLVTTNANGWVYNAPCCAIS